MPGLVRLSTWPSKVHVWQEMEEELLVVEDYLRHGSYPANLSKGGKANLRRKCRNNFKFESGVLYYRKSGSKKMKNHGEFVRSEEEDYGVVLCRNGR